MFEQNVPITVGRRKTAIARVRLLPGTGLFKINGHSLADFFPRFEHQLAILTPLKLLGHTDKYDTVANVQGGGITGQSDAIRLAIARSLVKIYPDQRKLLKDAGLLTRDARAKERKKYGQKRARKRFQFSKR